MPSAALRAARALVVVFALVAAVVATGAAPAGADGPLVLNPTSAASGQPFTISGTCTPNQPVQTYFADAGAASLLVKNGTGNSGPTGSFSLNATVAQEGDWLPSIPPFEYPMVAKCGGFLDYLEGSFTVALPASAPASTGTLTLSDTTPDAGQTIQVTAPAMSEFDEGTGDGFVPSQAVKIVMYPGGQLLGTATATGAGLPSTSVTIPAGASGGPKTLVAFGDYRTVAPSFTALTGTAQVTSAIPPHFEPLTPARILDSRSAVGRPGTAKVPAGGTVGLDVTGVGGVPASGVSAVILNVTVTGPVAAGFVTVHPGGEARPGASNLNYSKAQTIPNLVVAKVGAGGVVSLYTSASTHLIADVVGYFPTGSDFSSLTPARILDSRSAVGRPGTAKVPAGGTVGLDVTGVGGVPSSGVSSVILNVTVTGPAAAGYVTVHPAGESRPDASNLNYSKGQTIPNLVVAKVGAGGIVNLYSSASTHLIADVVGYFPTGADFTSLTPSRILDSRSAVGRPGTSKVAAGGTVALDVTGVGGVPASGVSAVILNVTVTGPTAAGYVTAHPGGEARPGASNLNYAKGQTIPNLVVAKVGAGGIVSLYTSASTHLIADVVGYFPG